MAAEPKEAVNRNIDALQEFYHHLGVLVIEGRGHLREESADRDWVSELSKTGFPDLANHYENLLLTFESDELFREGLSNLITTTGRKLRASMHHWQNEQEITGQPKAVPAGPALEGRRLPEQRREDITYLTHLLTVGSLAQKRMAAEALGNFLLKKKDPANKGMREEAAEILEGNRDPEVAFEVTHALSFSIGSEGKRAKNDLARTERFLGRLQREVESYWDGLLEHEPITKLKSTEVVDLGIWMRLASDYVVGHVGEVLIDLLAEKNDKRVSSYLAGFVCSADRRLLPVLIRILQDGGLASKIEAIKAIAHIDDPRSFGALEKAYRHSTNRFEKIVLARALARMGSRHHVEYISGVLKVEKNPEILEEALKAVQDLEAAGSHLRSIVRTHLESENPVVARAAARALSGIGTEQDIDALGAIAERHPKLRHVIKNATQTLYSHIILQGSEVREMDEEDLAEEGSKKKISAFARLRASIYYFLALLFIVFRRPERSLRYVERALQLNSQAGRTYFLKARIYYRKNRLDMAIETYRTAVSIDNTYTWEKPDDADRLIRAYLKRSRQIDHEMNAPEEALLLLGELDDFDLRRADPNLQIEIGRRIDALKFSRMRGTESLNQ
jgi:tetratricopeptide (TPR) repeat protein